MKLFMSMMEFVI